MGNLEPEIGIFPHVEIQSHGPSKQASYTRSSKQVKPRRGRVKHEDLTIKLSLCCYLITVMMENQAIGAGL